MKPARTPHRASRTWGQRLLLITGCVLTVVALTAAGVVAWAGYKMRQIDREDVVLDELVEDGPANFLVVGSDSRAGSDPDRPGGRAEERPALADTIMVVRVDPEATAARVLSLPRDLWVTLPDGGEGRVNAAYSQGPQALIDTIRNELDIPINHYVEVDFQGFHELVGAIDGVPMWFDRAMRDRNSGLDVLHPGCVVLDGQSALAFARARHLQYWEGGGFTYDGTGDLGRISRQQVFLRRVIDRARDKGLSNPLTLKSLVDVGTSNLTIDTQPSVSQLVALGRHFSSFDSEALETHSVAVTPRTTAGGAQVVELDPVAAEPTLDRFRSVGPGTSSSASSSTPSSTVVRSSEPAIGSSTTTPGSQSEPTVIGMVPGDPPAGTRCG